MTKLVTIVMTEEVRTTFDVTPDWLAEHGLPTDLEALRKHIDEACGEPEDLFEALDTIPESERCYAVLERGFEA